MIAGRTVGRHTEDFVQLMAGGMQLDMAILGMGDAFTKYKYMHVCVYIYIYINIYIYVYMRNNVVVYM